MLAVAVVVAAAVLHTDPVVPADHTPAAAAGTQVAAAAVVVVDSPAVAVAVADILVVAVVADNPAVLEAGTPADRYLYLMNRVATVQ